MCIDCGATIFSNPDQFWYEIFEALDDEIILQGGYKICDTTCLLNIYRIIPSDYLIKYLPLINPISLDYLIKYEYIIFSKFKLETYKNWINELNRKGRYNENRTPINWDEYKKNFKNRNYNYNE